MPSVNVDFVQEKEAGYQRIFARSPLLSSISTQWDGMLVAYDYFSAGQTPEICAKQHGIGIFLEVPHPAQVRRRIDGCWRQERVGQGDVVIVPADAWHQTQSDRAGGAIVLGLTPAALTQTLEQTVERHTALIPHFATPDPLIHQIGLALKRALQSGASSRIYAETLTTALIAHLGQYYCAQPLTLPIYSGGLSRLQLQRVIDYIQSHLDRDLSLKELAALVDLSPHYFAQLFKQSIGLPPHQYLIRCRIERAKELLIRQLPLAEIAKAVGFVDQSHFHRHFKRLVGVTPKAFMQQTKP